MKLNVDFLKKGVVELDLDEMLENTDMSKDEWNDLGTTDQKQEIQSYLECDLSVTEDDLQVKETKITFERVP